MAIDLRNVEPLGSKSVLLEQAMRRHRGANNAQGKRFTDDMDMSDMITPDFEWLKDDKVALQSLVKQMDASIGQLAGQVRDLDDQAKKSRASLEKEQQLLFKQISTLNNLLKKQVDIFSSVERQMAQFEVKQSNMMPNIMVGLIAGLMSAVTLLASVPWLKGFI
jgi:predicted RNase H-like nuclease (RuvC/YqgF family)